MSASDLKQQVGKFYDQVGESGIGQGDEPLHLHLHAAVHEAVFRQQRPQRRHLRGVAAVSSGSSIARRAASDASNWAFIASDSGRSSYIAPRKLR